MAKIVLLLVIPTMRGGHVPQEVTHMHVALKLGDIPSNTNKRKSLRLWGRCAASIDTTRIDACMAIVMLASKIKKKSTNRPCSSKEHCANPFPSILLNAFANAGSF